MVNIVVMGLPKMTIICLSLAYPMCTLKVSNTIYNIICMLIILAKMHFQHYLNYSYKHIVYYVKHNGNGNENLYNIKINSLLL